MWVRFPPGPPTSRLSLLSRPSRSRQWVIAVSVLLHLLVLALLIGFTPTPPQEQQLPPPDVGVVFESSAPTPPSQPEPGLEAKPASNAGEKPAPTPEQPAATPAPVAPPLPPVPPAPVLPPPRSVPPPPAPAPPAPPQVVAPSQPAPPPPSVAEETPQVPTPPAPAPEAATAEPSVPQIRLQAPPVQSDTAMVPDFTPDLTPPDLTMPPTPQAPPSRPAPRQLARNGSFPAPLATTFAFASPGSVPRQASNAPSRQGPSQSTRSDIKGADKLGPDWSNLLSAWVEQHKHYPEPALLNGEDGSPTVSVTVQRDGRVTAVSLDDRSGSAFLDMGLTSMFRYAHLPPFPSDAPDAEITFQFTMHYILRRG